MQQIFKITRLAPTPSGFIHLGNVYSFALTAALARKTGAAILLRIDDLDRERVRAEYIRDIFDSLHFLGIPWDEGPFTSKEFETQYSQVHRLGEYKKALEQLRFTGKVYACTCSRSQILRENPDGIYSGSCRDKNIPLDTKDSCWRLHTERNVPVHVKDLEGQITSVLLPENMHDFIVRRSDGLPAYQLSSLVDDVNYGVDLIVRGEDLWSSTLAQLYLAKVIGLTGFTNTTFFHHSLIEALDKRKLSKSAGDTSVHYLRNRDFSANEIYQMIARELNLPVMAESWEGFAAVLPEFKHTL